MASEQVKRTAAEMKAAQRAAESSASRHSKRPDPLQRWTRENVCQANGHQHGKDCD